MSYIFLSNIIYFTEGHSEFVLRQTKFLSGFVYFFALLLRHI